MVNAHFILLIFPFCLCGVETWLNVGTELFSRANLTKHYWSKADLALLQARKHFQNILPSDKAELMNADNEFVANTLDYFHAAFDHVTKETKDADVSKILLKSLSDAVGGYLKLYLLPITKVFYYSGSLPYDNASKVCSLYQEILRYLNSSGAGWREPDTKMLSLIVSKTYRRPRHKYEYNCDKIKNPCSDFEFIERTENGQTKIPLPSINWEDETMFTPIRNEVTFSLHSPKHASALTRYYDCAKCCANSMGPQYERYFDQDFKHWTQSQVVPHLNDHKMYMTLYDVLSLINKTQNLSNTLLHIYNFNNDSTEVYIKPRKHNNEPWFKFKIPEKLHAILFSKKFLIVVILVIVELILCCIVCTRLLNRAKDKEPCYDTIEHGYYFSGPGSESSSNTRCSGMGVSRNIVVDSEPGKQCSITVQEKFPSKPGDVEYYLNNSKPKFCHSSNVKAISTKDIKSGVKTDATSTDNMNRFSCICCETNNPDSRKATSYTSKTSTDTKIMLNKHSQSEVDPRTCCQSCNQKSEVNPKTRCNSSNQISEKLPSSCCRSRNRKEICPTSCSHPPNQKTNITCHSLKKVSGHEYPVIDQPTNDFLQTASTYSIINYPNIKVICNCPPGCTDCSKPCQPNQQNQIVPLDYGIDYGLHVTGIETNNSCHRKTAFYQYEPLHNETSQMSISCITEVLDDNSLPPHNLARTISIGEEIESIVKNNTFELIAQTASTQVTRSSHVQSYVELKIENPCRADLGFGLPYLTPGTLHELQDTDNISSYTRFIERQSSPIHDLIKDISGMCYQPVSKVIVTRVKDVCAATSTIINPFFDITMNPEKESLPITLFQHGDEKSMMPTDIEKSRTSGRNELERTKCLEKVHELDNPDVVFIKLNKGYEEKCKPEMTSSKNKKDKPPEKESTENIDKEVIDSSVLSEIPVVTLKCPKNRINEPIDRKLSQIPSVMPALSEKRSSSSRYSVRRLHPQTLRCQHQSVPPIEPVQEFTRKRLTESLFNPPENAPMPRETFAKKSSIPNKSSEITSTPVSGRKELMHFDVSSETSKAPERLSQHISVTDCSEIDFKPSRKHTKSLVSTKNHSRNTDLHHLIESSSGSTRISLHTSVQRSNSPKTKLNLAEPKSNVTKIHTNIPNSHKERKPKPPVVLSNNAKMHDNAPETVAVETKILSRKSRLKSPKKYGKHIDIEVKIIPEADPSPEIITKQSAAIQLDPLVMRSVETICDSSTYSTALEHKKKSRHREKTGPVSDLAKEPSEVTYKPPKDVVEEKTMTFPERLTRSFGGQYEKPRGILKYTRRAKITEPDGPLKLVEKPGMMKHLEGSMPADAEHPLSHRQSPICRKKRSKLEKEKCCTKKGAHEAVDTSDLGGRT